MGTSYYCEDNLKPEEPFLRQQFQFWLILVYSVEFIVCGIYACVCDHGWVLGVPLIPTFFVLFVVFVRVRKPYLIDSVSTTFIERNPALEFIRVFLAFPNDTYLSFRVLAIISKAAHPAWALGASVIYSFWLFAAAVVVMCTVGFVVLRWYGIQAPRDAAIERVKKSKEEKHAYKEEIV